MILKSIFDILFVLGKVSVSFSTRTGARFMLRKDVVITNSIGLHARPATFFIQRASSFKSSIWIEKDERRVNAKSLLGVLSLGIAKGMTVNLVAEGPDEEKAIDALVELINTGFAE